MNLSDSEEMAGQLLAVGCGRAPSMELADLIVINTCAVREHAEAKVIGRQASSPSSRELSPASECADGLWRPRVREDQPGSTFPSRRHVPAARRGTRAGAAAWAGLRAGSRRTADGGDSGYDRCLRPAC